MCIILVDNVESWHARFAQTRMRCKTYGGLSLTAIGSSAGNTPAFCVTDYDHNLIWIIEDTLR